MLKSINQLKIGALLSYMQMALSIIISLVYTPLMIRTLGQSEYGLYNTVSSTISMLSLLSLGFGSGYIRYYSIYKKEENNEKIYKLNGLFLIIFTIIGLIGLVCGLWLSNNLHFVFDKGLTVEEYSIARVLMLLLTVNLALSFPMSVFSNIISANERYIFLKLLGMLKTVGGPLVTIPILLMGYGSIALVAVTLAISVVTDILYFIYVIFILKNRFIFHGFEKGLFRNLFIYTSFIAINLVVDQINWNIDKLFLGRFQGTVSVAIYSVAYTIYQCCMTFSTAISGVFAPRIHRIVNETIGNTSKRRLQLTNLFVKVGRIQFLLLGLIVSGIIFFGKPFIYFWAGEGYSEAYYVALLLIIPATIALIQNIGVEIQRAEDKHQFRSIAYLVMACINLILTFFLCQKYGALGAAFGTAISLIVANGIVMNFYYHKKCDIDIVLFWKNIIRLSIGLIPPIVFGVIIIKFINLYIIWKLVVFICLYIVVYCISMWCIGMNKYERNLIQKPITAIFRRRYDKNS
ncbi:MAG: oligosaccharide flippase family protein [Clostridia bacterium]|nr:oligosaccharide flippase family protein [Clostridia bacterium]